MDMIEKSEGLQTAHNLALHIESAQVKLEQLELHDQTLLSTIRALRRLRVKLLRPLRIAILGELNSGKSSLANVLIDNMTLPTRAITNTRIPTLIRYSETPSLQALFASGEIRDISEHSISKSPEILRLDVGLPNEDLLLMEILDFPGLSTLEMDGGYFDVSKQHIDGALWCTIATAAWRENELNAWLSLPDRIRLRGILVVTHKDQLQQDQYERVLQRLSYEAGEYFQDIALVSGAEALSVLKKSDTSSDIDMGLWHTSGAPDFLGKLGNLCDQIRMARAEAAWNVTRRIAGQIMQKV